MIGDEGREAFKFGSLLAEKEAGRKGEGTSETRGQTFSKFDGF